MAIITYTSTEFIGGAPLIFFGLIIVFIAMIFYFRSDDKQTEAIKFFNAFMRGLLFFFLTITSYVSLFYTLETGELGFKSIFIIISMSTLFVFGLIAAVIMRYWEWIKNKFQELGFG